MRTLSFHFIVATAFALSLISGSLQAFERCVTDDSRRQVCVQSKAPSIISLAPGSTELLFAAGAGKQVIATDQYSDYPPEVDSLPKVGGYPSINLEAIISYQPELVIIWTDGNSQQLVRHLEKLGINTFHINAQNFEGIDRVIRKLGRIAGTETAGNKAANEFTERLAALKNKYQQQSELSVFFEIWREPLMSVGGSQIITNAIEVCGGRSLYADIAQPTVKVGMEQLITDNPDVILSSDPRGHTPETQKEMLNYWQKWGSISAVKQKQLYTIPSDYIARLTPRLLEGTEIICKQLQAVRSSSDYSDSMLTTATTSR
ncbi:hypothetical protein ACH42_13100 [Endozoicomonas sp. (ex Bugula neritina AB1)]|nr:hypothetical protein ACH42_13100 [Endozoicomonas sp. (ex Bugula neritina AB1)]